ncbi:tyrosine recombinase XerC [Massilioclostridium coli]|uniref:tyrosine recombinase XerC n=1 Tax=Massilioclostridium coli TaxID=1870991 RepID=UPI0022E2E1A7|nr:tyrosine recombinase XerC [Massilioclostridium coli]
MNYSDYHDMPPLAKDYLNYMLTIKGRSVRTVDGYAVDLRTFFRFMKMHRNLIPKDTEFTKIPIYDLNADFFRTIQLSDVYEFLNYSMKDRDNNSKTRARKVSSLRGFFKYLTVNTQILQENPVKNLELPTVRKTLPVHLNMDQSVALLNQAYQATKSATRWRDFCILTLFLNCGMRLSELVGINIQDLDLKAAELKLLGKGNKERLVYLNDACKQALEQYIQQERANLKVIIDKQALFLSSRSGKRIGARQVQLIVSKFLKESGLGGMGFSTHKLRHTAATLMYQQGDVDVLVLKELLGHVNVGTTEIYTHVSNEKVQQAVENNPLAHFKAKGNEK